MYWLYFARDFYRTAQPAVAAAPTQQTKNASRKRAASYAPKRQAEYATRSDAISTTAITEAMLQSAPIATAAAVEYKESPLNSYLERLSVDGEHAFGIWEENEGFTVFSANFERITHLSAGEFAGHDWIHLIHHTQQYAVNDALISAIEGRDGRCLVQAQRLADGAETRWLMMDIKAASAQQPNIMVMFRDLTEQRALEETLKQTESALAVSERSRAAFLSSMSHELRTPLNAIMGFSEMMKSAVFGDLGNPTYKEYAKHIHESGSTLLGKINDLLDIASMDSGGLEIDEEIFHLNEMLAETVQMHTHQAFERQQTLKVDCPYKLEVSGDRSKLMYAVAHLITNAMRHSKNGAEISLSVRVQHDEGVIISIRDAGEGISTAQLETIRNALNAEVTYFNIESGGIGLGLSLTKELATRHGGRVMIDSIRHRGTVVSMILPTERVISGMPKPRRRAQ